MKALNGVLADLGLIDGLHKLTKHENLRILGHAGPIDTPTALVLRIGMIM